MIQAIGLTSKSRKELPPAVDDVSFEARTGRVTALLGATDAGKTTVLRLMLELQQGRGITYFRGRPLHRIAHPSREVGVLLGEVPGHPFRSVRGHVRMLCAAVGVPVLRADDVLEAVGLVSLREQRLGTLSRGMDRRLALACALLADPHTLVLDGPADGLSARESGWLHGFLRAHAARGGTVLYSTSDPKEAARTADRVVTLDAGRIVADQEAGAFARTRLRPRVAVRTPHAARLAVLLAKEARARRRSVEVVEEDGNRLSVYGSTCADVGETAFRHGILVHHLADEIGDTGELTVPEEAAPERAPGVPGGRAPRASRDERAVPPDVAPSSAISTDPAADAQLPFSEREYVRPAQPDAGPEDEPKAEPGADVEPTARAESPATAPRGGLGGEPERTAESSLRLIPLRPLDGDELSPPVTAAQLAPRKPQPEPQSPHQPPSRPAPSASPLPPPIAVRAARGPLRPLRYELCRATGIGTGYLTLAAVLAVSALLCVFLGRTGHTAQPRLLAAWPTELPLPPAALGAGLLGALAFGEEFRHPALAADRGTVPRRLGLLAAKLVVAAATALLLAALTVGCDAAVLHLVYGSEVTEVPADWLSLSASWLAFMIGCAWAGVLAAGVFRSTTAGLAAVVAVPIVVVPLVQKALAGPSVRSAVGLPGRLRQLTLVEWPFGVERYLAGGFRMMAQPVGAALALSVTALLCAYLLTATRNRAG
ncbi:ATP-binding cassette domain-containing protein [Streptomyces flavofungini]|uniref:ATP-binding cassette domain-containing protein n=1 Tax=Streptomyces flavofungini TaxID=68200 RepID=A0ABS0XAA2_9ACTN|nr:ATP-binding cassette domain-containing protein [Streptomyces flavofungini]MBJ3810127.1 ATP-binding cassette domain-containing protein [Streptomyces flavofungini]GHC81714.1 ABC transporter [Streptomyces flavofungini]